MIILFLHFHFLLQFPFNIFARFSAIALYIFLQFFFNFSKCHW